jgi:hypothetical protein
MIDPTLASPSTWLVNAPTVGSSLASATSPVCAAWSRSSSAASSLRGMPAQVVSPAWPPAASRALVASRVAAVTAAGSIGPHPSLPGRRWAIVASRTHATMPASSEEEDAASLLGPITAMAGYTAGMSAQAGPAGRVEPPGRTPAAVRSELPEALRASLTPSTGPRSRRPRPATSSTGCTRSSGRGGSWPGPAAAPPTSRRWQPAPDSSAATGWGRSPSTWTRCANSGCTGSPTASRHARAGRRSAPRRQAGACRGGRAAER